MSLWPDGFKNPVFPLGFHWYPRWEELLITAGQGQEFYLPTKPPLVPLSLGMIDIPCNFSPHGSTDVTDSVTSLLLSGGEGPDFPLSPPLSPPQWGRKGALLLHGKNGSPGSTYGVHDTVHRERLYNLVEMKVLAPHSGFSDTASTRVLGYLLTE